MSKSIILEISEIFYLRSGRRLFEVFAQEELWGASGSPLRLEAERGEYIGLLIVIH